MRPLAAAAALIAFSSSIAPDARTVAPVAMSRACGKIGPSLNLKVDVLNPGGPGIAAVIAVKAAAGFDAGETRFTLMPPEGWAASRGDGEWSETLAAGCVAGREIVLAPRSGCRGGVVAVRAEVGGQPVACEARAAIGTPAPAADSPTGTDLAGRPALFTAVPGPAK